jgi:hypothetical protein
MVRGAAAMAGLVVLAVPGARSATFPFPSENATVIGNDDAPFGEVGTFSSADDAVSDTFHASTNIDRAILRVQPRSNDLGAPVTWALEINCRRVGSLPVGAFASAALRS